MPRLPPVRMSQEVLEEQIRDTILNSKALRRDVREFLTKRKGLNSRLWNQFSEELKDALQRLDTMPLPYQRGYNTQVERRLLLKTMARMMEAQMAL